MLARQRCKTRLSLKNAIKMNSVINSAANFSRLTEQLRDFARVTFPRRCSASLILKDAASRVMSPRCCISVTSDDASRDVTDRRWCFFASDFLRHWCSFIIPRFAICRYAGWRNWWPKIAKALFFLFLSLSYSRIRSLISKTVGPNITPLIDNGSTLRKDCLEGLFFCLFFSRLR